MSSGEDRYPRPNPPRARPKPKPKPKARKPTRAVMPGDPGFGTGPDVRARARRGTPGSTSAKVKVNRKTGRVTQPKYRSKPKPDADFAAWAADVDAGARQARSRNPVTGVKQAGFFTPEMAAMLNNPGGSFLGDLLGNLGGDAVSVITGIPNAAQLAGKNVAYPVLKALGKDEQANSILKENVTSLKGAVEDYKYRYGPLFEGQFGKFGERSLEHPGLLALDAAAVGSLAGSGVRAAAAGIGRIAPETRLGATAARIGSRSTITHARPNRTVTVKMGENSRATHTVEVPQRPFSRSNPLTRGMQKGGAKVRANIRGRVEGVVEGGGRGSGLLRLYGTGAKHARAVARVARDFRMERDLSRNSRLRTEITPYVQAVKELDRAGKWTKRDVDAALFLHSRDLLRAPGKTPLQARDAVVAFLRKGLDEAVTGRESKHVGAADTIDAIAKVPDALLDLEKGPPQLRAAVEQYRALAGKATKMRVGAGTVSQEAASVAPARSAQMVHEGIQYNKKAGVWTSPRNPYSAVGSRAVYTKDVAIDPLVNGGQRATKGAFGRLTQDKEYQSHGTLFRQGNVAIDRGLPIRSMERAITDEMHPQFVKDVFDTFAFRKPKGGLAKGPRAIQAMAADPKSVVLIGEKSLRDAMRRIKDAPEGEIGEGPFRGVTVVASEDDLAKLTPKQAKDLVAFPKSAIDGIREGWDRILGGQGPGLKQFDTAQQLWKRGILAFAPRWYLNSLFGNATQYVLATGGDAAAVYKALRNPEFGTERVKGSTNVAEARTSDPRVGTAFGNKYRRMTDRLMNKQAGFDALWRRALYINRARQQLRAEGVKTRGMTMDDLSKAMETADPRIVRQATRDVELWLGDYLRMSPTERATLRRIFPFYSWMRVIGKLTLNMPLRYPKRTAFLAAFSRAATESQNPEDPFQRILANRGMLNFGPLSMRSAGANPFFTNADIIKDIAGGDQKGLAGSLVSNLSPIALQQLAQIYSGTTAFGSPISYPPGYGGTASEYGKSTQRIDPVTGLPDYFEPGIPLQERLLQTIPLAPQILRGLASGNRQPYDVTTTLDLLTRGKSEGELFYPPRDDRALEPIPTIGPFLGWAGLNLQRRNRAAERSRIEKQIKDFQSAQKQTANRKRKVK